MEHNHHDQQRFTCPMHPEIVQDKPGNCPKCGMNLILVNARAGEEHSHQHKQQETEKHSEHVQHTASIVNITKAKGFQKFTCPMHPQVVQDEPGKCPLCGMTLVPLAKPRTNEGHQAHSSGIADFKKRFYIVLVLTIPIMLLSEMIQHWLNIHISFPGSKYVLLILSSYVFWFFSILSG